MIDRPSINIAKMLPFNFPYMKGYSMILFSGASEGENSCSSNETVSILSVNCPDKCASFENRDT